MPACSVGRQETALYTREGSGLPDEGANQPGKPLRLVLGRERARVVDLLESGAGNDLGQALAVLGREEAIVLRPSDERGPVPAGQLEGGVDRVLGVESAQEAANVTRDLLVGEHRQHVGVLGVGVDLLVGEPAVGDRQAPQGPRAQAPEGDRNRAGNPRRRQHDAKETRREVLEGVAGRQHEGADALRAAHRQDLGEPAARVAADHRHVVELERLERIGDQIDQRRRAHVRLLGHRLQMRAERQIERHSLEAVEARDHLAPEVRVDQRPVHEDDGRPLARHMRADPASRAQVDYLARTQLRCSPTRSFIH